MPDILRAGLDGFSGLIAAAGGPPPSNLQLDEAELLTDFCRVTKHLGRAPTVDQYRVHGTHSPTSMTRRFGAWGKVKSSAAEFAMSRGDDEVLALLARGQSSALRASPVHRIHQRGAQTRVSEQSPLDCFTSGSRVGVEMMSDHYAKLYCLERHMREIISSTLAQSHGDLWWENCVPLDVRDYAKKVLSSEKRLGVTPRSSRLIDYITLGQSGQILDANWSNFQAVFKNQQAMQRIMRDLNMLRAFVAHCTPLPSDEIVRLDLNISDWLRQLK